MMFDSSFQTNTHSNFWALTMAALLLVHQTYAVIRMESKQDRGKMSLPPVPVASEDVHEGRLAGARRTHDGCQLSRHELARDGLQDGFGS